MDASMPAPLSPRDAAAPPAPSPTHPPTPPADPPMDADSPSAAEKTEFAFSYELRRWADIEELKVYSPWQYFAGFSWRLLIFPRGNQCDSYISVYLECGGPGERPDPPPSAAHPGPSPATDVASVCTDVSPTADENVDANENDAATVAPTVSHTNRSIVQADLDHTPRPPPPRTNTAIAREKGKDVAPPPVVPQIHSKEAPHTFHATDTDWGFREFCSMSMIHKEGYEEANGSLHIGVKIKLEDASPDSMFSHGTWDSRKMTGYVGFKNQGATCYMNSLLQTLYMLGAFRRAVYNMPLPDPEDENAGGSRMSYALQKVFYELQYSSTTVKTKKLTESFGWDNTDAFTQHDVQELNRILCDHLEERMKKIAPDQPNTVSQLFEGKILNYIECVNVNYKSTREESFYDLSLNVKGCRNIYDSFDKYCEVEMMDGDNKYAADGFEELQVAKKGVRFLRLPPVLQLHLKRFEYDLHRDAMVKINDRFEYMTEIDLSRYVENSDGTDVYLLHSVLVHVGDVNGGHYYAYIRPTAKPPVPDLDANPVPGTQPSTWYKFDDDMVTATTEDAAVADNYGSGGERDTTLLNMHGRMPDDNIATNNGELNGNQTPPSVYQQSRVRNYAARRLSNAYMLQYIRKDQADVLLTPANDADVPQALAARIESEQREEDRQRRDRAEQHLYMNVIVATDKDMAEHDGADVIAWDKIRSLRVKRAMRLRELKVMLQDQHLVADWQKMRLWKCCNRKNNSIRPEALLADGIDDSPIAERGRDYSAMQSMHYGVGYQTRYGIHSEYLKVYVEDFLSPYCFGAGEHFAAAQRNAEARAARNREADASMKGAEDEDGDSMSMKDETELDVTDGTPTVRTITNGFRLVSGEMLLFLKRYVPSPSPHLEWVGHCVMDRHVLVGQIFATLYESVKRRSEHTPGTVPLESSAPLALFEEESAETILPLDPRKTFEASEIPLKPESCGGDILVFMDARPQAANIARMDVDSRGTPVSLGGDGGNENGVSSAYDHSLPLGGRPLPNPVDYYRYLLQRVKVEFKDKYEGDMQSSGICLELLSDDSYLQVRSILARVLGDGCDADHLRFFSHDSHHDRAAQEAIRAHDDDEIRRMLPSLSLSITASDYRILWYERTEYAIGEYENREEVRVTWRPDGGTRATPIGGSSVPDASPNTSSTGVTTATDGPDAMTDLPSTGVEMTSPTSGGFGGARTFSVLVPIGSRYEEVASAIRAKLDLEDSTPLRLLEVRNFRVSRFLDMMDPVSRASLPSFSTLDVGSELRAELVSEDEASAGKFFSTSSPGGDVESVAISVSHIAKDSKPRGRRVPVYFGVPVIIRVPRDGEKVGSIRQRIRKRLDVPEELFETWNLVEVYQNKLTYLKDMEQVWIPEGKHAGGVEACSLAIEHYGSAPAKKPSVPSMRFAENHKPLKIKS